jgi:hypothetical protein
MALMLAWIGWEKQDCYRNLVGKNNPETLGFGTNLSHLEPKDPSQQETVCDLLGAWCTAQQIFFPNFGPFKNLIPKMIPRKLYFQFCPFLIMSISVVWYCTGSRQCSWCDSMPRWTPGACQHCHVRYFGAIGTLFTPISLSWLRALHVPSLPVLFQSTPTIGLFFDSFREGVWVGQP